MADKLDIEAERLVAELRRTYTEWNNPPSSGLPHNASAVLLAADTLTALIAEVRRLEAVLNAAQTEVRRNRNLLFLIRCNAGDHVAEQAIKEWDEEMEEEAQSARAALTKDSADG